MFTVAYRIIELLTKDRKHNFLVTVYSIQNYPKTEVFLN